MIRVAKPTYNDPTWTGKLTAEDLKAWKKVIEDATEKSAPLVANYGAVIDVKIDENLYKRYMAYLLRLFNGKCAYCEVELTSNQPGDVEHFRPKGRVVDENFKPIRILHPNKGEIDHPGYFWLAYEWGNLFPSCIDCNRYRKHGNTTETGVGKADRFPVDGPYARTPADVAAERALLLNPSEVDPTDHLEFFADGSVKAKSRMGEETLKVLGLNRREGLVQQRKDAYEEAFSAFNDCISAILQDGARAASLKARINEMWLGRKHFSACQRLALEHRTARLPVVLPFKLDP